MPEDRGDPGCTAGCLLMALLALYVVGLAVVIGGTLALLCGWVR